MEAETIRTSEPGWLAMLAKRYKNREHIVLIDDAGVGIDPREQNLLQMGKHAKLSKREWSSVCIALGVSALGIGMIVAAIVDPEPTSKLGILLAGGIVCIAGGGFSAIRILIKQRPPTIKLGPKGFEMSWN